MKLNKETVVAGVVIGLAVLAADVVVRVAWERGKKYRKEKQQKVS